MVARVSPRALSAFISLAFAFASPFIAVQGQSTNFLGCIDKETASKQGDLFPHKSETLHSDHWSITYHDTYKVVKNTHVGSSYLLYQCGTEPPADVSEHQIVVPVPLQDGIALTQTTYIPHVELLGKRTDITYIGSSSFISSPCLNQLISDDSVEVVDGFNATAVDEWLEDHPLSVILSNPWTDPSLPGRFIISESAETASNKAVFEWHKVFAALFNLEHLGNRLFEETSARYDCVSENAAVVESDKEKPKVLWASYVDYYDSWSNTTTIGWQVGFCPNYYCEFAEHCSATFMEPESGMEGSLNCWGRSCMTDDEFKVFAMDADYWIYSSNNFNAVYDQKKDMLNEIPTVKNKEVYDTYGSGPNTWFEQRMAEYDVVLQDMCDVVGSLPENTIHKRKWFRNVLTEPLGELPVCTDVEAPLQTQATECAILSSDEEVIMVEKDEDDASGEESSGAVLMTRGILALVLLHSALMLK